MDRPASSGRVAVDRINVLLHGRWHHRVLDALVSASPQSNYYPRGTLRPLPIRWLTTRSSQWPKNRTASSVMLVTLRMWAFAAPFGVLREHLRPCLRSLAGQPATFPDATIPDRDLATHGQARRYRLQPIEDDPEVNQLAAGLLDDPVALNRLCWCRLAACWDRPRAGAAHCCRAGGGPLYINTSPNWQHVRGVYCCQAHRMRDRRAHRVRVWGEIDMPPTPRTRKKRD